MSDDSRISPYNVADCKNTTDDALQNYLNSLKFRQSHWYTDVKLAMGYTAVIIAAATFALDYKLGFEATKQWTTLAVVAYFVLNAAFTYWIWQVEKGLVYIGAWKGRKITISTRADKFDPTYRLSVTFHPSSLNTIPPVDKEISAPFMQWFTADGFFVAAPFQQWLATNIPMVGDADPKNILPDAPTGITTQSVRSEDVKDVLEGLKAGSSKSAPRKRG